MVDLARAWLDRIIFEQFQLAVAKVEDEKVRATLTRLQQLFALSVIEQNKGWYLEDGYMEAIKTKAIRKMVNQLCWDIRKDAVPLVEAFDIPDSCLAGKHIRQNFRAVPGHPRGRCRRRSLSFSP